MSQDKYVYLRLKYDKDIQNLKVAENEYKDMLKTLRMWDNPTQYWVKDVRGCFYNINKVLFFWETTDKYITNVLDAEHEHYLKNY